MRKISRIILAVFFLCGGFFHFASGEAFAEIVPPFLPFPFFIVWVTGVMEIFLALGLCFIKHPMKLQKIGWLLSLYCLAVLPANIYMAIENLPIQGQHYPLLLWMRIPLQFLLIAWILWATQFQKLTIE